MAETQEATAQEQEKKDLGSRLPVTISAEINAGTRSHHTALNRLITSRLPLALPPHTSDSSLYTTGMLHFAHIFLTFESLRADLVRDTPTPTDDGAPTSPLLSYLLVNPYDSPSLFTSTLGAPTPPSPQLAAFLQTLRPKGLIRSGRLKKDLEYLLGLHATDLEVLLAKYPGDKVAEFCTHIRKSVNEKPWTLLSYSWCFYMAVFSGGRWIRGQLLKTPPEFWPGGDEKGQSISLEDKGLSFWHFTGPQDGEDIKAEFKERLAAADGLLTPDERVDIIEEAKSIFQLCASLVDELDGMLKTDFAKVKHQGETASEKQPNQKTATHGSARAAQLAKSSDAVTKFLQRPHVTGTLVALGCLACYALVTLQ
ncbi:heme oxygenase-like protein [Cucurbitaria berberidis CBS 394.84]|uniref:Heme oxygenase-like protein n=1 Tax=Cucurbitaria berberidis CBS 394.84 TaxID=1168544 RepID=A0A9P4GQL8_9PLEO|nr:heme oxygenase-like protein [Cucurbitaria berberidis CBS 394.84]KAF1849537.1 heme oxygenase-like protein [Cucurbitaria berberidis CBS 394.84]